MKCSKCGAELSEDTKFCSYCGHKIDATPPAVGATEIPPFLMRRKQKKEMHNPMYQNHWQKREKTRASRFGTS